MSRQLGESMVRGGSRRSRRVLGVSLVLVALVAAACGSSSKTKSSSSSTPSSEKATPITGVPGVTDTEIRFGAVGVQTNNPLGNCFLECFSDGVKAYFAYRNSQGGIYGRKLVLSKVLDDELGKAQQRAIDLTSANDTFAAFQASFISASAYAEFTKAGFPVYTYLNDPEAAAGKPNVFGAPPSSCTSCTTFDPPYAMKLAGAKKIAGLGLGASPSSKKCAQAAMDEVKKYSSDIGGAEGVYVNGDLPFGLPNGVAPEVTAMKKAGVDFIVACFDLNTVKAIRQELIRQGMSNVRIYAVDQYDPQFMATNASLMEGTIVGTALRPWESDTSGTGLGSFKEWMKKTDGNQQYISEYGWLVADIAYQGLKAAGPRFDRQKVIDATNNKVTQYTGGGLISPTDWGRQHEPATQDDPATHGKVPYCFSYLKVHNGKFEFLAGSASKPFLCWPGTTRDWSEPVAQDFK